MKKLFLCAAIAVFGLSNVNAQEVKFGVKAGVNFATLSTDIIDAKSRTSFHFGGVAEISISEKFSVQPELMYSSQGAKSEFNETFEGVTISTKEEAKLDYISIPIMAKYYVAKGFSLEAGPQVSFLMSAKYDYEFTYDGSTESESEDIKDITKGIDFGLGFGAGYKMDSGFNFGARYSLGLSNINDDVDASDESIKNNVFQLSVGYFF
jgi:hypothetical protein